MDPVAPAQAKIIGGLRATGKLSNLHRVTEDFKELVVVSDASKLVVTPGVLLQTRSEVSLNPWICNGLVRRMGGWKDNLNRGLNMRSSLRHMHIISTLDE